MRKVACLCLLAVFALSMTVISRPGGLDRASSVGKNGNGLSSVAVCSPPCSQQSVRGRRKGVAVRPGSCSARKEAGLTSPRWRPRRDTGCHPSHRDRRSRPSFEARTDRGANNSRSNSFFLSRSRYRARLAATTSSGSSNA